MRFLGDKILLGLDKFEPQHSIKILVMQILFHIQKHRSIYNVEIEKLFPHIMDIFTTFFRKKKKDIMFSIKMKRNYGWRLIDKTSHQIWDVSISEYSG